MKIGFGSRGLGGFRTPEAAERYRELYETFVARHWPVTSAEVDVATRYGTTRVRRSGPESGTPVVMIHPTTGASLGWHVVVGPIADHHPVYTPDTIGTAGLTVQTAPVETSTDLARWLDDLLDGLSLQRVHLVGYSEGGWIAGVHAGLTEHGERIRSLTLIEPGGAIERVPPAFLVTMIVRGAATLLARDTRRAIQDFSRWLNGDIELSDDELELAMHVFRNSGLAYLAVGPYLVRRC